MSVPNAVAPVLQAVDARTQATVRTIFNGLINWTATLPVNPVTNWLEGGLLMVRKSLFNQSAGITPTQTANSAQLIKGKIDIVDPDGDDWNVEIVGGPGHGTVVLGTPGQAHGIGAVDYTYTPGEGYAGDDQFVVKVTSASRTFNILDPFGLMSDRYYTVAVGNAVVDAENCFGCTGSDAKDTLNTHLFLSEAGATVTVKKQGLLSPTYSATITLPEATANRSFSWMDTRGNMGSIPVDQMLTEDWSAFTTKAQENAAKPLLVFTYADGDTKKAVFVDVDDVAKNSDGTYTVSGELMADSPAQNGRVDRWDFIGVNYKAAYENFLASSGLDNCKSGQVCSSVSAVGILGATTLSPSAFTQTGGHDYQLPIADAASAVQTSPGSMGPGTAGGTGNGVELVGNTGNAPINLTAMVPWGTDGSFIAATNLTQGTTEGSPNGIFLYTANASGSATPTWTVTQLMDNQWNAAVTAMAAYDQILLDPTGTPIPTTYTGTVTAGAATSTLTLALPSNANPGSLIGQEITGQGIAPNTVISGFVSVQTGSATFTVNNAINSATTAIAVTAPNIPTQQPGLIVGLSDGGIYYWNGATQPTNTEGVVQGWAKFPNNMESGAVTAIISLPNNQGLRFGFSDGNVVEFAGQILADGSFAGENWGFYGQINTAVTNVNALIPSGQDGGWASANTGPGGNFVQAMTSSGTGELSPPMFPTGVFAPTTLLPYDGTTMVGAISGTPVVVDSSGNISTAPYASLLSASQTYLASTAGCTSSYGGGNGSGCSGYLLTVQQAAGNAIRVGQTLYGGAGLLAGTTITQQISDADGNLCADSCNAGGTGVYLVNASQLVAPGTPMSASDGTGFIIGTGNGQILRYDPQNGLTAVQTEMWSSAVNAMIPWRDGFVVGLNNGATMYWSPSNNPGGNNPNNPDALAYAGSTVTSTLAQSQGWSQLMGLGWGASTTSMVQMGDGFAQGLTAWNNSVNGGVQAYTGFGPVNSDSAFGFQQTSNGPVALAPSYSFADAAGVNALAPGNGSVQQLIAIPQNSLDSMGNLVMGTSLVVGQTNNGIYTWNGSNANVQDDTWSLLQEPGDAAFDEEILQGAWTYGQTANNNWGAAGGVGNVDDPVFGLPINQAWCGTDCSGDYYAFVYNKAFGDDGVIYSIGTTLQADLNLSATGYGYVFVPSSFIDKFGPDNYSVGLVLGAQGGPSVVLNPPPADQLYVTDTVSVTGPQFSDTDETEFGTIGVNVGVNASVTGTIGLQSAPLGPLELAQAFYTPGMLYTWNTYGNRGNMGLDFSAFPSTSYISAADVVNYFDPSDAEATLTATATPYVQLSYGLYTPKSWSFNIDIFDLTVGYQNPVTAALTVPLTNIDNTSLSLTSSGVITASANFLPSITSSLSWNTKYQLYSVTDQIT